MGRTSRVTLLFVAFLSAMTLLQFGRALSNRASAAEPGRGGSAVEAPREASSTDFVLLALYLGGGLSMSFLCSILEATLLSSRTVSLVERSGAGDRGAAVLLDLKQNRIDDAISAILTLNTISHTAGTAMGSAKFQDCFGEGYLPLFTGGLTVVVLLGTEIVPKTIGTVFATRLVGFTARTINVLVLLLKPILVVTRAVTGLLSHGEADTVSRGELAALVGMAAGSGAIRADESRVLENVLGFDKVKVEDVMTPRTVVTMLPTTTTLAELLEDEKAGTFSRIPVFEANRDRVVGYVLLREALLRVARGEDRGLALDGLKRKILFLQEGLSLSKALARFLDVGEHMAVVVDEFGGTSGLLTLEDVIETVLGVEIVDESDKVTDLRKLATEVRDRRLASMKMRAFVDSADSGESPETPE